MPRPTHTADFPFAAAVTTERTIGEARNLVARRPEIERTPLLAVVDRSVGQEH